ncbi:hypothetical protein GCM10027168_17060 [Streptomyces capparidis]
MVAGHDGTDREERDERELRLLLERAVPHLPAPEERMRRVRQRVVRRRRRQVAGAVAGVVAAAVVTLLLRTPPGADGAREPLPAASPSPPSSGSPLPSPSSTVQLGPYTDMGGIDVRVPNGWVARSYAGWQPATVVSTVVPEALHQRGVKKCEKAWGDFCLPPQGLKPGTAVISFHFAPFDAEETAGGALEDMEPGPACLASGGDRQLRHARDIGDGRKRVVLQAVVCLKAPYHPVLDEVDAIARSAIRSN